MDFLVARVNGGISLPRTDEVIILGRADRRRCAEPLNSAERRRLVGRHGSAAPEGAGRRPITCEKIYPANGVRPLGWARRSDLSDPVSGP